jgi:hypothetical protein
MAGSQALQTHQGGVADKRFNGGIGHGERSQLSGQQYNKSTFCAAHGHGIKRRRAIKLKMSCLLSIIAATLITCPR